MTMTTTEKEKDTDGVEDDLTSVTIASVMCRQHEKAALAHKHGIEHPDTMPHERVEMEEDWARHLAEAKDYARQRDEAIDRHLAALTLTGGSDT